MFRFLNNRPTKHYKYIFVEVDTNHDSHVMIRKTLDSREIGMRLMEKELIRNECEVLDLIYRDSRKHKQEFRCTNGLIFIINRI